MENEANRAQIAVSRELIAEMGDAWSPPVQVQIEAKDDGTYELHFRRLTRFEFTDEELAVFADAVPRGVIVDRR